MNTQTELLACPFCGKAPKCSSDYRGEPGEHVVVAICFECPDGCSVSKDKPTYDEAVAAWNTRHALAHSGGTP
jgi:polyferredoxin